YLVAHEPLDIAEIRSILSRQLPDYMVPAHFVQMEQIPLTPNGKVNRKELPEPKAGETGPAYIAPRDHIEETLVAVWAEVLRIEKNNISLDSGFFDIGGHSLKATLAVTKIHKILNVKIPLGQVFKNPTLRGWAEYIKKETRETPESAPTSRFIQPAEKKEYYALSSIQKSLYILDSIGTTGTLYNLPAAWILQGPLHKEAFRNAFRKLVQRHQCLRTSFTLNQGTPVQIIHENFDFEAQYREADENRLETIAGEFVKPFDLSRASLMRVTLVKIEEEKHFLLLDMHHIISDGVSVGLLAKDFLSFYQGRELQELKIQYKDWAQWLDSAEQKENMKKQEEYWLD
ncbi:MAG: non-ribosomal peptide synthetase, partial [bacterium]|nr:non-ribosomal peptide synthetase [bacterium]